MSFFIPIFGTALNIGTAPLHQYDSNFNMVFEVSPCPGVAAGRYIVDRHYIDITLGGFTSTPYGWYTAPYGYSWANPNNCSRYLNKTTTSNSIRFRTVFYYIKYNVAGQTINRWAPFDPNLNSNRKYAVLGIPAPLTATMSGPDYLTSGQLGTWTANASGGTPPYTYKWYFFPYCDEEPPPPPPLPSTIDINPSPLRPSCGQWYGPYQSGSQYSHSDYYSFDLKCVVTDANGQTATATKYVSVSNNKLQKLNTENELTSIEKIPEQFSLNQNYPNPFNPTTQVSYQLPEKGFVVFKIYDVLGREIRTLVNEEKESGFYSVDFNGDNLPSGMYIYSIRVQVPSGNNFVSNRKMLLIK